MGPSVAIKKMFMKYRFFFLVLTLLSVILCGWGFSQHEHPTKREEKILKLALRTEPLTLDPKKNSDGITSLFITFISEGLTRIAPDGKPAHALAEKIILSEDQLHYTFILREAHWSDGTAITSYDFKDSWVAALDPAAGTYNPEHLFVIANAKEAYEHTKTLEDVAIFTPDEKTLEVTLAQPTPYFLELVATKMFFPAKKTAPHAVSGPFAIGEWVSQDKIALQKNPWYWDQESVQLEKIELYLVHDETTQLLLFEQGALDWVGAPFSLLPIDSLSDLKTREDFYLFPTASLCFYSFNTQKFPLNNIKLRKALTYAMQRDELIQYVSQGEDEPALAFLPPKLHGRHQIYFQDGAIAQAQELFKEALKEMDLTPETFPTLVLSYPAVQPRHVMAQAIQQQWQDALGIHVALESKEWQVFLSDLYQRQYDIGALGRGTHHLDPIHFLSLFKTADQLTNFTGWEDKEYQHLLDAVYKTSSVEERYELLYKAENIFMEHMPLAPIFFPTYYYLKNPHLKGVVLSGVGGIDFKWAYFD